MSYKPTLLNTVIMCDAEQWTRDIRPEKNKNEKATLISENKLAISAALVWKEALLNYLLAQNTFLLNQMASYEF